MRRFAAILCALWMMGTAAWAQEAEPQEADCQTLLSEAEIDFGAGKFYGIPSLLQSCIDRGGYSREEQVRVYMLLTQVYLLTDDPANAEASYLKLLHADPEYVAQASVDPIDIVYLSKKFTTTPIFTPHFKIGPNFSPQTVLHEYGTSATPEKINIDHRGVVGVSLGAGIEWNINDNLGIGAEGLFSYKAFATTISGDHGGDQTKVTERQFYADFPLYARYGYNVGKVRPFAYAGYAVNVLFGDLQNLSYTINRGGGAGEAESSTIVVGTRDVLYKREMINGSLLFGGGIKYKLGKNFLLLDARYMKGLKSMVIEEFNQYADNTATADYDANSGPRYNYVDPIFKVNSFCLYVGFVRPLYDPRLARKAKTKGVSRKISGK